MVKRRQSVMATAILRVNKCKFIIVASLKKQRPENVTFLSFCVLLTLIKSVQRIQNQGKLKSSDTCCPTFYHVGCARKLFGGL